METTTTEAGYIYGVRLQGEREYRYVGMTTKTVARRFAQHLKCARDGRKTPFYDWLRKQDQQGVRADELQEVWDLTDLGQSEIDWIAYLKRDGHRLLNLSKGGLGPTGVLWTAEQREAARLRSTGRKGLSRFGEANPFYGRSHTPEQRLKWAEERAGQYAGPENPNFGRFGAEHPRFGSSMTPEARKALSDARTGAGNPNFGKKASEETRAKMSAVRAGRPMPSSRRSAHTRYHSNKGVEKADCRYCVEDSANPRLSSESESES
ncbi:NUMOD3 domain-containing DNA-binding protein [Arthrobacter gengyunqii]|uniref:NUMOD3 motif protein n=1 Tax=Arthrobacter gengyunqii TaxID=2886940 RepID=A0A9X1M383_9MICC|nr:NUMOD3 domain-containing DNA-binding protein [Arthrobacter gengyunqii]MCC3270065.1 NUMOD3 motif protein [Arthrobacter gengyunqii]UOY95021.1 NUMOD3 domain-containing DNA-binding protein [Arthrobacter gengyunqii]